MFRHFVYSFILSGLSFTQFATRAAAAPVDDSWQKLITLAGDWEGQDASGQTLHLSYELLSDNSALLERFGHGPDAMISVYHRDGDAIQMTHFCSAHNQPRLRAMDFASMDELHFAFLDITNLPVPTGDHINGLTIFFRHDGTVVESWSAIHDGVEEPYVIILHRVATPPHH